MICAALTFHPNQKNPARAGGRGVWRVYDCFEHPWESPRRFSDNINILFVWTDRIYKTGSRVDPVKLALRGLAAKEAA